MEVIKVTRDEYDKIVRGEAVEKDGKIIQFDPVGEVHKPTKEQIKEALDAVCNWCINTNCDVCKFSSCGCELNYPCDWDEISREQIAEVIADDL